MKINWKARFQNKTFVVAFTTLIIAFAYQAMGMLGIVPSVSENEVMNMMTIIVNMLATLGVLVDPTTEGLSDSERAMTYYTDNDARKVE